VIIVRKILASDDYVMNKEPKCRVIVRRAVLNCCRTQTAIGRVPDR